MVNKCGYVSLSKGGFVGWRPAAILLECCKPSQRSNSFFIRTLKVIHSNTGSIINSLFLEY